MSLPAEIHRNNSQVASERAQPGSRVSILGNNIDCFISYRTLYDFIRAAHSKGGRYITVNNVHTMMEGFRDPSFQAIINEGFLSIPDGKPLQVVGKLKGNKEISRLFGPTVMEKFIDWGREDGISHFFFGSSDENLQKLTASIAAKYPGVNIAGMLAPPFLPMDQWDNKKSLEIINAARPDFIWVGLGAPKQERWMYRYARDVNKGVMFGIGAGFDYLSGNTKHAPEWMKNNSLEWLYRLIQEPRRLWKRYATTIPPFLLLASLELMGIQVRKNNK